MDITLEKKKRRRLIIFITVLSFILSLFLGVFIYLSDYYEADMDKIESFIGDNDVEYIISDDKIIYNINNPKAGLIFYPGGKVEYLAYLPLMEELAKNGILCVLLEVPFNLAILDVNAADNIIEEYDDVSDWYISGHSLGGSVACMYLEKNYNDFKGLILLGSYSSVDLSKTDLNVLSIYGENDNILNMEKYIENKKLLPQNFNEVLINGGCHSYFGVYGNQDGDGIATISNEEQINLTVEAILEFLNV